MGFFNDNLPVRDLFDIARKDEERYERDRARAFADFFQHVFDYRPELGEPEVDGDNRAWWVQGLLWSLHDGRLVVLTNRNKWVGIDRPRDLLKYDNLGLLKKENYDIAKR